jgi:hypothetical protein
MSLMRNGESVLRLDERVLNLLNVFITGPRLHIDLLRTGNDEAAASVGVCC